MPMTASGGAAQRNPFEAARKGLRAYLDDPHAVWDGRLAQFERRLKEGWGHDARKFRDGMDECGVVLLEEDGHNVTQRFITFLLNFSLGPEEDGARGATGSTQLEAAEEMVDVHDMSISAESSELFSLVHRLLDDRSLLLQVRRERQARPPLIIP